jgi:hypothetical protein
MRKGKRDNKLRTDGNYLGDQSDKIRENLYREIPRWLEEAIEQKNPRLTLALADSILLVYDDLDKKLLAITSLN